MAKNFREITKDGTTILFKKSENELVVKAKKVVNELRVVNAT